MMSINVVSINVVLKEKNFLLVEISVSNDCVILAVVASTNTLGYSTYVITNEGSMSLI